MYGNLKIPLVLMSEPKTRGIIYRMKLRVFYFIVYIKKAHSSCKCISSNIFYGNKVCMILRLSLFRTSLFRCDTLCLPKSSDINGLLSFSDDTAWMAGKWVNYFENFVRLIRKWMGSNVLDFRKKMSVVIFID